MRIAQIAPLFESVPPSGYGGTERVVSYLTEALVDEGHEVTLFASGDSRTQARLVPIGEHSIRLAFQPSEWLMWQTMMIDRVFAMADQFDVIHFHTDFLHYPLARRCKTPIVTTMHGRLDLPDLGPLHRYFRDARLVSISDNQRLPLQAANWQATVHHGIPEGLYQPHAEPLDYFAFIGRISPEKRLDRAIQIALACETPLRVAAKTDPADAAYFEREIRPWLDHPLIEFVGEIGDADKNAFLGQARALLFPIDWPEPFGLVMIESFACGTPVIAYDCGSVREVMEDGVTGFIVQNTREAIDAARRIGEVSRQGCRAAFERRFTATEMARNYLDVYRRLVDNRIAPRQDDVAPL